MMSERMSYLVLILVPIKFSTCLKGYKKIPMRIVEGSPNMDDAVFVLANRGGESSDACERDYDEECGND